MNEAPSPILERTRPPILWPWCLVFGAGLALYGATANYGLQGRDSGYYIIRALRGKMQLYPGLAIAHPLHYWLCRLLVRLHVAAPHVAVTGLSAFAGAVTVANVYGCVATTTRRALPGVLAAASLAVAHTFWQMATVAEVYTLSTALLSMEAWCVVWATETSAPHGLRLACLFNGLGLVNHPQALLSMPMLGVLTLQARRPGTSLAYDAAANALCWCGGAAPWAFLLLLDFIATGSLTDTLRSAAFGSGWTSSVLNVGFSRHMLMTVAIFPVLNFPNLLFPVALGGILYAGRLPVPRPLRVYLLGAFVLHFLFVIRYNVGDQYTFFLPAYFLLVTWAGIGWAVVLQGRARYLRRSLLALGAALIAATPLWYYLAPGILRSGRVLERFGGDRACEGKYVRMLVPWSCADSGVDTAVREAFRLAGPDGLILCADEWLHASALEYQRATMGPSTVALGHFPHVDLTHEFDPALREIRRAALHGRRVVLIPDEVGRVPRRSFLGAWVPSGPLYTLDTGTPRGR